MGFWLFCTASSLLIPLVMLFFGRRFFDKAAQEHQLPLRLPHRTIHENQQTWDLPTGVREALVSGGAVMLPLSLLAMLPALGRGTEETGMWCIPVTGCSWQCLWAACSLWSGH